MEYEHRLTPFLNDYIINHIFWHVRSQYSVISIFVRIFYLPTYSSLFLPPSLSLCFILSPQASTLFCFLIFILFIFFLLCFYRSCSTLFLSLISTSAEFPVYYFFSPFGSFFSRFSTHSPTVSTPPSPTLSLWHMSLFSTLSSFPYRFILSFLSPVSPSKILLYFSLVSIFRIYLDIPVCSLDAIILIVLF